MVGRLRWITPLADADVSVGATAIEFTIPDGTMIDMSGQDEYAPSRCLVVTEKGRNNIDDPLASGQVRYSTLQEDNEVELH